MEEFIDGLTINSDMPNTATFLKSIMKNDVFINENHNVNWLESIPHLQKHNDIDLLSSIILRANQKYQSDLLFKDELIKNGHLDYQRYINFKYSLESVNKNVL